MASSLSLLSRQISDLRLKIQALEKEIIDHQIDVVRMELDAITSINQLRPEVHQLLAQMQEHLPEKILEFSNQIADAPLFHPLYEELLEEKEEAESEEEFYENQKELAIEEIEMYIDGPYPEEAAALRALYKAHITKTEQVEKAYDDNDIPSLFNALNEEQKGEMSTNSVVRYGFTAQLERLSDNFSVLMDSPLKKDIDHQLLDDFDAEFLALASILKETKEALEESLQLKKPSERLEMIIAELEKAVEEVDSEDFDMNMFDDDLFNEMLANFDGSGLEPFGYAPDEVNWQEVENPKHPIGSSVRINASIPGEAALYVKNTDDWQAWVLGAYSDGEVILYDVILDSVTLNNLPKKYIKAKSEEGESFAVFSFRENEIAETSARDTLDTTRTTFRTLHHRYFWGDINKDAHAKKMYQIMLAKPAESDLSNWLHYFAQGPIELPAMATVEGIYDLELAPNTLVEVVDIYMDKNEEIEDGLIAKVEVNGQQLETPLLDLMPLNEDSSFGEAVLDYRDWADYHL
jgi:hypothetical protein